MAMARANARQQQIARQFEQHIADEENTGAHPVCGIRKAEIGLHLQLRKAHIDAVQIRKQVADEQKRQQPPIDLAVERRSVGASRSG
jgi:hypothetical protein